MRTVKARYWIERNEDIGPYPTLDNRDGALFTSPHVRVFTNLHGGPLGALAAVFYGHTQEEAEELARAFLHAMGEGVASCL